ncbi:MAG: GNAT family N-acetyltransferase [Bacilli bacterium]|nr:GNAT family N-acetyltransferase [Bacilli bacterium]
MLKIYNLKDKKEYIDEVAILTQKEWGKLDNFEERIAKKVEKINKLLNTKDYVKLVLLDDSILIGFISIFPNDGEEYKELTPWYATMYVKKEYRGLGYSKLLNDAILKEAKKLGYKKIYLKTNLVDYYEKFGAKYIDNLKNGEKLYYIDL